MEASELPDSLDEVDIPAGLPRVANNKKLYKRLLLQMADEAPSTREKMAAAVMNGDMDTVRDLAHSLKGASGNLSITKVYAAVMDLERAASAGDAPQAAAAFRVLEQALDAYTAAVAPLRM